MVEHDGDRRGVDFSGALLAWKRRGSSQGVVMTLQIVEQAEADHRLHRVRLKLNDRQLRSMARDLARVAQERGLNLERRKPLHKRMWRKLKALLR